MDQKKTDYGNWVPLALMKRLAAIAGALLAGEVLLIVLDGPTALTLLVGGLLAAAVILWLYMLRYGSNSSPRTSSISLLES